MESPWAMDRDRIGWWAMAFVLGAGMAFLIYSFIGTFVFGVFLYYATRPVHRRVERVVRPPSLAAGVSLLLLALPALLLLVYTIAIGLQELNNFLQAQGLGDTGLQDFLEPYFDISSIVSDPQAFLAQPDALEALGATLQEATTYLGFFGNGALHLFVMILIAFYLLRDDHRLAAWWRRRFSDAEGVMEAYVTRVDRDFSHIFFGNLLNAFLTGIIGAFAYGTLDFVAPDPLTIPYPALLGLLTGVASLVPVVGIKLVYVPLAAYLGFLTIGSPALLWFPVVFVLVSFVIVDVIPDLVLRPYVSGRNLHLGMVMIAYIFGPLLFGWYGIFLGPMLLVLLVHFAALVLPELLAGSPIQPEAVGKSVLTGEPLEPPGGDTGTDRPGSEPRTQRRESDSRSEGPGRDSGRSAESDQGQPDTRTADADSTETE